MKPSKAGHLNDDLRFKNQKKKNIVSVKIMSQSYRVRVRRDIIIIMSATQSPTWFHNTFHDYCKFSNP